MNPRLQELFEQICDLDLQQRESAIKSLDASDRHVIDELRELLESHDAGSGFLGEATIDLPSPNPAEVSIAKKPGDSIGRYKLLEQIGEGGFGLVYMAQQSEPVRRRVALKIIKLGMDTGQMVARFEAESQALAMMDHPNIARVLDGGATASGRPFFVMELVRGEPVTEYCDRAKMPVRERLQVFQQVCRALEHAHQKGIVHRDIKPSNVLVTIADGKPMVKVIDFGIAKALNVELTDKTLYTEFRQLIGTPQYMSPEQAERSGVDIDTRSDIFSLGVLLYEILTGTTPVDSEKLKSAAWGQWQKLISEEEPSRPSVQVASKSVTESDIAKHRSVDPTELTTSLRGDLDWIVLKSIEKDRSRRYATASQFADDIDRYLNDEPVLATPPSKRYLAEKFIKRHRRAVFYSGLLAASIIIGLFATAATAWWAVGEREDAIVAQSEAIQAKNAAEKQAEQVRRMAALAGAPLLRKEDADQLAAQWADDIDELRQSVADDNVDRLHLECQYATWLAGHAMRYNDRSMIDQVIHRTSELEPRVSRTLPIDDANRLSMLNSGVQVRAIAERPASEIADWYDKFVPVFHAIRGEADARSILLEYAVQLCAAKRIEDARKSIDRYLSAVADTKLESNESTLLNRAISGLTPFERQLGKPYQRLLKLRDTGQRQTPAENSEEDDKELASDLKKIQGVWKTKSKGMDLQVTMQGNQASIVTTNPAGEVVFRGIANFKLGRSGAAKILTRYFDGQDVSQGDAVIYSIDKDTMIHVEGMLTGVQNNSEPTMRIFKRKK